MSDMDQDREFIHTRHGYCYFTLPGPDNFPMIYGLFIRPEHRGCGKSKGLIEYAKYEIRKTGYTGVIEVEAKPFGEGGLTEAQLCSYYERLGLKIVVPDKKEAI